MGNSSHPTRVRHSSRKSSATHSCQCVQCFHVSQLVRLPVLENFNVLTDSIMLMRAITHGGCTDTQKSLDWELNDRLTLRASLSGTFLQTLPDLVTPLKWRSLSHCEHCFPAPYSKLCQIWLRPEGALFISAQLSSDAVSAPRKVRILI